MLIAKVMFFVEVDEYEGKETLTPLFVLPEENWKGDNKLMTAISIDGYVPCQKDYLFGKSVRPAPIDMYEDMKRKMKLVYGGDGYIIVDAAEWVKTNGKVFKEIETVKLL